MPDGSTLDRATMRLLIVARHCPPAVSGGAMRPYLFARELIALGHEVRIVAPNVCPGVPTVVVPHHHVDPAIGTGGIENPWRTWARRWMLPDPDIRWALRAARAVEGIALDWVISTSPPESSHVAGWLLKRRFRCRWLADFRDHWFAHPLYSARRQAGLRISVEQILARILMCHVDALIATSSSIAEEAAAIAPAETPVVVIEHSADRPKGTVVFEADAVHIVHTGSFALSDWQRALRPILEGFVACDDDRLRLHLVGRLRNDEKELVANLPNSDRIVVHGVLDSDSARAFQAAADILLLVTAPDTPHVPGKLAEYRATGKPVMAIGGGAWQEAAGIAAFSDAKSAFANLQTLSPAKVRLTPVAAADRLLALLNSVA